MTDPERERLFDQHQGPDIHKIVGAWRDAMAGVADTGTYELLPLFHAMYRGILRPELLSVQLRRADKVGGDWLLTVHAMD